MDAGKLVRIYGDPLIRETSSDVGPVDSQVKQLVKQMTVVMRHAAGIGIAAPQIGVLKKLIVVDLGVSDGHVAYVNPRILSYSKNTELDDEGCLCVPGIYVPVKRSTNVEFTAHDLQGREVHITAGDYLARILQHEVDHLHGTTIMERTDSRSRRRALRELLEREDDIT